MNIETMNTPKTRSEFERNFYLFNELIINNRYKIMPGANVDTNSIARIRKLPNQRINFLSVDENARLQVNMTNNMFGISDKDF